MSKFRVMVLKKNGKPVGVRAAALNGKIISIALTDENPSNWHEAVKKGVPSLAEWLAILENKEAVNKALKRAGGTPLKGWYWSSSELSNYYAWYVGADNGIVDWDYKDDGTNYVRCVLA